MTKDNKPAIGITVSKADNISKWYTEILKKTEIIDYYDVSGCYVIRPWIFNVWEEIQNFINKQFKLHQIKNCYFPMFVTKQKLEAEENHLDGFAAEVAWVTKSGSSELTEPIAIRPTSETIMYPIFATWIRSHRDLPVKVNQWCPVVRWEFSDPTPFLRTREFLWQEGHTAHASPEEARDFALKMLHVYEQTYTDLLAIPVNCGRKSDLEKFAGGDETFTIETFIANSGRSIQAATSHYLSSNFANIYNVKFEAISGVQEPVYQTSFGLSTRSIGAMILIHSDDKGLVLPPKVSSLQVIVIPIIKKAIDVGALVTHCEKIKESLLANNIRADCDLRENYNPGYKFSHWELKGVPLRLEVGPKDLSEGTFRLARRVDGFKADYKLDLLISIVETAMTEIHKIMYENAFEIQKNCKVPITSYQELINVVISLKQAVAPWCNRKECEKDVKVKSAADLLAMNSTIKGSIKTLYTPLAQTNGLADIKCFNCDHPATQYTVWGRSY
uniref:Proline--tRNA ligase n=1 Tax=Dermatophagoides pteronyssinus TaxID=6956 RepID=A0A6P6YBW9_DERPT|nr:proline--tRNA ligase, cytoplasmic-like [Dermatophagoides pteronyssinus]